MARTETDYDLPALTFDEGARVLGVSKGQFMEWVMETVAPSPGPRDQGQSDGERAWALLKASAALAAVEVDPGRMAGCSRRGWWAVPDTQRHAHSRRRNSPQACCVAGS